MSTKKSKIERPQRDPDHYSKRGVGYWWNPEWIRGTSADDRDHERLKKEQDIYLADRGGLIVNSQGEYVIPCPNYGRIHAVKEKKSGEVNLYMKAKDGNLTYIQGSIQEEFKRWHLDRSIDYMLLGLDVDDIIKD